MQNPNCLVEIKLVLVKWSAFYLASRSPSNKVQIISCSKAKYCFPGDVTPVMQNTFFTRLLLGCFGSDVVRKSKAELQTICAGAHCLLD